MNLTSFEIKSIVKIARDNPEMVVEDIIKEIINGYRPKSAIKKIITKIILLFSGKLQKLRPSLNDILLKTCTVHGIKNEKLKEKNRKQNIIRAKQQYCLVAYMFHYTLEDIGNEIGKDHATVSHHKKKALGFIETELDYSIEVARIFSKFPQFESILQDRLTDLISQ